MKEKIKKSFFYVIGFMVVVCLFFGLIISIVYNSTSEMLERNERLHRNRILCDAFMIEVENNPKFYEDAVGKNIEHIRLDSAGFTRDFYRLKDDDSNIVGFGFEGIGFWGSISGILVLSKDLKEIINIRFFEHKETPGLGARIEEEWFTAQFRGIKINWDKPKDNRVVIKQASGVQKPDQIDAIAGATQTSMALERILNDELERIRELAYRENLTG